MPREGGVRVFEEFSLLPIEDKLKILRRIHDFAPSLIHQACGCPYVPGPLGAGICPDPKAHDGVIGGNGELS